jgi:hypothetical protein
MSSVKASKPPSPWLIAGSVLGSPHDLLKIVR